MTFRFIYYKAIDFIVYLYKLYLDFTFTHFWPRKGWGKVRMFYYAKTGKKLNYSNPQDLNEKLMWLERYWQHPLKTLCTDKYEVRNYVVQQGLGNILVPLIHVYDNVDEINFDELPDQFVLKCNHGCDFNIFCFDKETLDREGTRRKLNQWMKIDYSKKFFEAHYHSIQPKIICEQLISETAPIEYQFWCINGQPQSILACRKNFDGTYDSCSYSLKGIQLFDRKNETKATLPVPLHLDLMIEYAKRLSQPFPFVRVDFYETDGKLFFAELTFSPSSNILFNYNENFINRMGRELMLPNKIKHYKKCI